ALTKEFLDLKVHESPQLDEVISIIVEHTINQPELCPQFLTMCREQVFMEFNKSEQRFSLFLDRLLRFSHKMFCQHFKT
ncbi:hypothetical protein PMAYCL1PPCAC_27939, partial [Pristionchus mayeri]